MRLIRDDAQEKMKRALILVALAKSTKNQEILSQHLEGIERILILLDSSMKGEPIENG